MSSNKPAATKDRIMEDLKVGDKVYFGDNTVPMTVNGIGRIASYMADNKPVLEVDQIECVWFAPDCSCGHAWFNRALLSKDRPQ